MTVLLILRLAGIPACKMVTGFPAIANMPVRDAVDVLEVAEKFSVAGPVPFVPDKALIQLTELETSQFTP